MNEFGISDKSWFILLKVIASFDEIERALIFGSRAKGNYKKGSDIDLAIDGQRVDASLGLDLSSKLNEGSSIPYFVDVVVVNGLQNAKLTEHIERIGKEIYKIKGTFKNPHLEVFLLLCMHTLRQLS